MARRDQHPKVSRRKFLSGVAVAGAAASATTAAQAATAPEAIAPPRVPSALRPSARVAAAGIDQTARAEQIPVEGFIKLANAFKAASW